MDNASISSSIYRDFAESVEKFQKHRGDPETLVSASGLATNFKEICTRRATRKLADQDLTEEDRRMLKLEANTWELFQRVYEHRRKPHAEVRTAQEMLKANPYTPMAALYRSWLSHSPRLAELCEVQKWLESTCRPPEAPLLTKEYWKFTLMDLKQKKRQGQTARTGYVRTMDPDATNRTADSGMLNADDGEEEKVLVNALFHYVRAGRMEEAAAICEKAARPWRAAVLRGSYHFDWPGLEALDEPTSDRIKEAFWSGNRRWLLWRQSCGRAALSTSLSATDRALHAAVSPSLVTLSSLLPMCRSWEDHLWARLSALIGDRIEAKLSDSTGGFWNRGTLLDRLTLLEQLEEDVKPGEREDTEWEAIISHQLDDLGDLAVDTSITAEDFLRRSQLAIITQKMKPLLDEVEDTFKHPNDALPKGSIRFFAHLWLFLSMINAADDLTQSTVVVEKYIEILQGSGERDIVALYTSFLGHAAIKKYADYLASHPLTTPQGDLERALRAAASYHLDVRLVAEEASRLSRNRAAKFLSADMKRLPDISKVDMSGSLTEGEQHMIRSLAWLRFHPLTQDLVLRRSNDDARWLLCRGRIRAAMQLIMGLPESIITTGGGEAGQEVEYLLYTKLFGLWDQFSIVEKMIATDPRNLLEQDGQGHWKRRLEGSVDQLFESAIGVMLTSWGVNSVGQFEDGNYAEEQDSQGQMRKSELRVLRKIYIPEIAIRLTRQLTKASRHSPSATAKVMALANLVADGKDKLHLDFAYGGQSRLSEYLLLVREAIVKGMEERGSDPLASAEDAVTA